jgi:hypothetical protein
MLLILGVAVHTSASNEQAVQTISNVNDEGIIDWLRGLAGNYVILYGDGRDVYLYTDPAGLNGVYYNANHASSTPTLLLSTDNTGFKNNVFQKIDEWYPGDLTPFANIYALMANHRLEVSTGQITRFWPRRAESDSVDANDAIKRMAALLKCVVTGLNSQYRLLFSLTGGRDTRIILAAARDFVRDVEFFTIKPQGTNSKDVKYARELATRFKLKHQVVESAKAAPWIEKLYDEITSSMSYTGLRGIIDGASRIASPDCVHVGGLLGETLRAYSWPSRDPHKTDPMTLARLRFLNVSSEILEGVRRWRLSIPDHLKPEAIYDLMLWEQETGRHCLPSGLFYAAVNPLNSREVFEILQTVPKAIRYNGSLQLKLIRQMWPELLEIPMVNKKNRLFRRIPDRMRLIVKNSIAYKMLEYVHTRFLS